MGGLATGWKDQCEFAGGTGAADWANNPWAERPMSNPLAIVISCRRGGMIGRGSRDGAGEFAGDTRTSGGSPGLVAGVASGCIQAAT